jgi:acyl-CoA dehydrogenase
LNEESLGAFTAAAKSCDDKTVISALDHATSWYTRISDRSVLEAGARRFALTLGRTMELALLIKQARWSQDAQTVANARRFAASGIDLILHDDLMKG